MRTFLTSLTAAALVWALAPGAAAQKLESTATATAPDGVLYNDCVDHPATYAVTLDRPDRTWYLTLRYQGADGSPLEGNIKASAFGDPTTGTMGIRMCGDAAAPGTFTVTGRLQYDALYTTPVPPTTFEMRNPFTSTAIKPSTRNPRPGQTVTIKIKSRDEMPGGYTRKDDATVLLQTKVDGDWKKVKGSKALTNEKGKAKVKVRYTRGKLKLRAVTKRSADWDASHSRKLVLH